VFSRALLYLFTQLDALGGGNVLEEFLDQVDMSENHAAAAVAL
jgi:hypothetical protein